MADKFGTCYFRDMVDRGRRELGSVFFQESPNAQPMYPLHNSRFISREPELAAAEKSHSSLDERLARGGPEKDDPGRDDRGMDRE